MGQIAWASKLSGSDIMILGWRDIQSSLHLCLLLIYQREYDSGYNLTSNLTSGD